MTRENEIKALAEPLSPGNPCGNALDSDPLFARIEAVWVLDRSTPADLAGDTSRLLALEQPIVTALERSKDLRLLAALAILRLRTGNLASFLDLLSIAAGWVDNYWNEVFPLPSGADFSARRRALERLAEPAAFVTPAEAMKMAASEGPVAVLTRFSHARASLLALMDVVDARVGSTNVPDLRPLIQALTDVVNPSAGGNEGAALTRSGGFHQDQSHTGGPEPHSPSTAPKVDEGTMGSPPRTRGLSRSAPPAAQAPQPRPAQGPVAMGRTRGLPRSAPPPPAPAAAPAPAGAAPREQWQQSAPPPEVEPEAVAAAPPPTAPAPAKVECHVLAEIDAEVVLNETTTLEVSLSREAIAATAGRTSASTGAVQIDAATKLLVQIVPRANIALAPGTEARVEVDPPAPGQPVLLYFDVTGAHEGAGEIWVIVRQRQMGIARLALTPAVVATRSTVAQSRTAATAEAVEAPPLAAPLDQLDIFEQTIGNATQYLFQLEMPSLNLLRLFTSPPLTTNRDDYVASLYKEIETRYISSYDDAAKRADVAAFTSQLQAQGVALFDRLFPFELQQMLWAHRDAIRSVRVVSTEPFIPWEIVHLREPGVPLDRTAPTRFLGQMGLVRWLHNVNGLPPTTLPVRSGRTRYVIPDYVDPRLKLPATVNERLFLEKTFAATPIEPQPMPLQDALAAPGSFDLLHLACHGFADSKAIAEARLMLQGRDEEEIVQTSINVTTVETFANMRGPDGTQPLVFLNACQAGRAGYQLSGIGGFAHAFLRGGAGAFVGTLWSVGDQPAFFFGKAFYEALDSGATLSEAAVSAREAARRDDATWLAYVVYGHPHARLQRA